MSVVSQFSRTLYNGANITASVNYVYNGSLSEAATSGWKAFKTDCAEVHLRVATLNSGALTYRIEGRMSNGYTSPASIDVGTLSAGASIDKIVRIQEHMNEIRLGVKVDDSASPNNFYAGLILTETK